MMVLHATSRLLVSVSSLAEARMVMDTGIDILDLKNPEAGALGALMLEEISAIVDLNDGRKLTSATIGDVAMQADLVTHRVEDVLATGVDIVKIGLLNTAGRDACIDRLRTLTGKGAKLVAVLFADLGVEWPVLEKLNSAGFYGVMLDTASKDGYHLLDHMPIDILRRFVDEARALGLCSGLAGSLRAEHLELIEPLGADYIGFRGGVCDGFERRSAIDVAKISALHKMLLKCNTSRV